jgi:hypothetical protein
LNSRSDREQDTLREVIKVFNKKRSKRNKRNQARKRRKRQRKTKESGGFSLLMMKSLMTQMISIRRTTRKSSCK